MGYLKLLGKSKLMASLLILVSVGLINSVYADHIISCDVSQTIKYNEELGEKECVGSTIENESIVDEKKKKKSDNKPFNLEGFTFGEKLTWWKQVKAEPRELPEKTVEEQRMINDLGSRIDKRTNYYFKNYMIMEGMIADKEFAKRYGTYMNYEFGENNERQILYENSPDRWDNPEFVEQLMQEQYKAQKVFLDNWGNFTRH